MEKIKLIGLDLDGTLFNDQKQITGRTIEAIKNAVKKGVIVVPATGRPISGIPKELLDQVPEIRYALTANGALIIDLKENKFIYQDGIPYEQAQKLVDELIKYEIMIEPYIEGEAYTGKSDLDKISYFVPDENFAQYFVKSRRAVDNISDFVKENHKSVEKIHLLFADPSLRLMIWEKLNALSDIVVTSAVSTNLEINKSTVNKGKSLIELGRQLGIDRSQIMACGDSGNDIEMLKAVGFSVAMGNASSELKELADFVTLANEQDGVAYAIEKFILN